MKFIPELVRSPDGESAGGAEAAVEATPPADSAVSEGEPNDTGAQDDDAAAAAAPTPPPSAQTGLVARIGQLTRQKRELEERMAAYEQAQQQYAAPIDPMQIDPETARRTIDLEISRRAQMLAQQEAWKSTADRVWNEGTTKYPDWATQINTMAAVLGEIPRSLTEAAIETGAPVDVLYHLAQHSDQATQIALMPASKQGVALAKIASEVGGGGRKGSNAPPPVTPRVAGGGVSAPRPSLTDPNISMEKWVELRNAEIKAKRGRR